MKSEEYRIDFGDVLRAILDEDQMTAYELSMKTDISKSYLYASLKPGSGSADIITLKRVLRCTGRTWAWLDAFEMVMARRRQEAAEEALRDAQQEAQQAQQAQQAKQAGDAQGNAQVELEPLA